MPSGSPRRAAALAAFSWMLLGGCNNRLFLHPTPPAGPLDAADMVSGEAGPAIETISDLITTTEDDFGCSEPRAFVLTLPGNAMSASYQLDQAYHTLYPLLGRYSGREEGRCGVMVVAMNYPGYGNSEGHATLRALGRAALLAYDHVVEQAGDRPVFVHGYSMGTTAALHITVSRPDAAPAGLILERGPDIPGMVMGRFGWWNAWLLAGPVAASLPRSARSVPNARRIQSVPAVFILGTKDRLVRPRNGLRVYEAYGGPKRLAWLPIPHNAVIQFGRGLESAFSWLLAQ